MGYDNGSDGCVYDTVACFHSCEGCKYGALKCPYCDEYVCFEDRLFEEDSICPYCDKLVEWGDVK